MVAPMIEQFLAPFQELQPAQDYQYTSNHLWFKLQEPEVWRIGLDQFAALLLGHIHEVIFPLCGSLHSTGSRLVWVTNPVGMVAIPAPLPVLVLAMNQRVRQEPRLIVSDPMRSGWLIEGQLNVDTESTHIISDQSLARWWRSELDWLTDEVSKRLHQATDPVLGKTLPDGGQVLSDLPGSLGSTSYRELLEQVTKLK